MRVARTGLSLPQLIEAFLVKHLVTERNASGRTVESYATTLRLLLRFSLQARRKTVADIQVGDWSSEVILAFLKDLEVSRANSPRTRNQRLAAIKSFFKYVGARDLTTLGQVQQVLAVPMKRFNERLVGYLTHEELEAVLAAANRPGWCGQRDHAMFLTTYFSAARVSEVIGIQRQDAELTGREAHIRIRGKGRKERVIVLPPGTTRILRDWADTLGPHTRAVFPTRAGEPLTRSGVADRLRRAVALAARRCPSLQGRRVSPHVLRHTMAMHLLESGRDITEIALFLGHESYQTTHKYVVASLPLKRKALESLPALGPWRRRSRAKEEELVKLLESLQRTGRPPSEGRLAASRARPPGRQPDPGARLQ